jgi:hypothetical protein
MRLHAMSVTFMLFWLCLGGFMTEILLGKFAVLFNGAVRPLLGDVSDFLLLALAAALLTAECLQRETRRKATRAGGPIDAIDTPTPSKN